MREEILKILKENRNLFISGEEISKNYGISRAAIWKHIKKLKEEGYEIESITNSGYKLISCPDLLTYEEVSEHLNTKYIGRKLVHFDTIDSTNKKAKELASQGEQEGTVVVSETQTLGKGRFQRKWSDPKGKSILMSIILKPKVEPSDIAVVTLIAAAAVCKALYECDMDSQIKWPNDIIINNKKICGILTEMSGELNQINYVIIGIGINVNTSINDIPDDLLNIASSLKIEKGKDFSRKKIIAELLNNFEMMYDDFIKNKNIRPVIDICRKNSSLIGKTIQLYKRGDLISAKAEDIDDEGRLVIRYDNGECESIISGEVTMHMAEKNDN